MTWAKLQSLGRGSVSYALVIEGWPHIFVTDPALTLEGVNGDRTVIDGLQYDGLRIRERAYPGEGRLEADGITFRFRPPSGRKTTSGTTDPISASFARRGSAVGALGASMNSTQTTITMQGASTLTSGYYYVGTETIGVGTFPNISRAQFGSYAQKHNIEYIRGVQAVTVYDYPTTIDGRRVRLYAYGKGDDVTVLGTEIWRGIVATPPRLESDCVTWSLACNHIIHAWKQSLVAEEVRIKAVGIYHHREAPVGIQVVYNGTESVYRFIGGFHADPGELVDAINVELAAAVTETGAGTTNIRSLRVQHNTSSGLYELVLNTGTTPPTELFVACYSALIGAADANADGWIDRFDKRVAVADLEAGSSYKSLLVTEHDTIPTGQPFIPSPTSPSTGLGGPNHVLWAQGTNQPDDDDPVQDYSPWRIYIDHNWTTVTGSGNEFTFLLRVDPDTVISDESWGAGASGGTFKITDSGTDGTAFYVEVEPIEGLASGMSGRRHPRGNPVNPNINFRGFLTSETVIRPIIQYVRNDAGTNFLDFVEKIIDRRIDANDGITPFLTPEDFDINATLSGLLADEILSRVYAFSHPATIEDVVASELLLTSHMLYTTSTGQLSVRQIPIVTDVAVTTKAVSANEIITPAGGYGMWPGYELQAQGIVSTVKIKQGYDPSADEWNGTLYEARDPDLIARHKKRGVGPREIAPRSNPASGASLSIEIAQQIAGRLLGFLGREYAAVRVNVPFTCFGYLLGDVVTLTSPHVPNAVDGSRGVSGKRAIVVGREWNLDPAREDWGTLELWILLDAPSGYAPSALITSQANTSGNTWTLVVSAANLLNILLSTLDNGQCLQHYADGDYIRIVQFDSDTPTVVTGRISGAPNAVLGTCTVNLDGAWTPGASTWFLEFQADNGSTAQSGQRAYVYAADNDKRLATGVHARAFS